jgi:1-aminocyclopropane-1-carboxylate deaminase/D-cysteine desulfhydrase-like pyridoxal-dependent ACC family enzyme
MNHLPFTETNIDFLPNLSNNLGVNLFIKRDDVFHLAGGGNKARKLQYILYKVKYENYNAIVTAGDINSNHCRATAMMTAALGMKVKLIIHNEHPENEIYSKNMQIARLCGAEIIYCSKENVVSVMDIAMDDFKLKGYKPYYIWGGGHSLEGSFAYYDAVKYIRENDSLEIIPNFIYFASGTGTTHAGIHVGNRIFFSGTNACGISISRKKDKGLSEICNSINELEEYLNILPLTQMSDITFFDEYLLNGYESTCDDINNLINNIAKTEGLMLDSTYSGKAFWGMINHIRQGIIPKGCCVLFWHTGGLFNLLSNNQLIIT